MPTELLPQPPPGVPAPPPGEQARKSRRKFRWIIGLGLGSLVLLGLWEVVTSMLLTSRKSPNLVTATSNARQIGQALLEFENQYSKFPDATTAALVQAETGSTWTLSEATSNDLFQQLIVSGIALSEEIFYAKTPWTRKADNLFTTESQALATRECSFAYIAGLSAKDDPSTPICVTPLEPGKLTFDRNSIEGNRAIILCVDQRCLILPIDPSGRAILNGMDLFDPRQPFWHGKAPNVKWPK
ncbi:MAG: hypothetical protein CFE26_24150 [Verrucomicrobiales bacterium VVV1]|nr:MAG: hypothetical protein CFE26_24150 [Verrucomicrobiales bacterium VVV1]